MDSPKINFDDFTKDYDELLKKDTKFFSRNEKYFAEYKVNIIKNAITQSPKNLLEFGCGTGRNIRYLLKAFPNTNIYGSDVSVASIDVAKIENPTANFYIEEKSNLNLRKYDLIFVAGVFHHIEKKDRLSVMASLFERLENGGRLIIFEHNPLNPITRRIVSQCPYDADAILLGKFELKKLLCKSGFKIYDEAYCLFIPPKFGGILWMEKFMSWIPLGGQYWISAFKSN